MRDVLRDLRKAAGRTSALGSLLTRGGMVTQAKEAREISDLILSCVKTLDGGEGDTPQAAASGPPPLVAPEVPDGSPGTDTGEIPLPSDASAPVEEETGAAHVVEYPNCQCGHPSDRHHAAGCEDCGECSEFTVPETSIQGHGEPAATDTSELL